jgi:hypothetical protein
MILQEIMNRYWNLREELYRIFHRWPYMLAAVLVGGLLGWGISLIWPAHYRATSQIYLALNPYRKFEDTTFEALANPKYSNLDNYLNWQMGQLEAAIYLDEFLQPTLEKLRLQDPYWDAMSVEDLRNMLSSEWRTTGSWSLIADYSDPTHAQQAAKAWSEVTVDQISAAVESARETFMIDQQLQAGEDEIIQANLRLNDLVATRKALDEWEKASANADQKMPLEPQARWQLLALVTKLAKFTPAWMRVLENQPPVEAPLESYLDWIEQAKPLLQAEAGDLQTRLSSLNQDQINLAQSYSTASRLSLSFSPNIEVKRKEDLGATLVRSSSTFILVGSTIGLLIWLLSQLIMISTSSWSSH